jgi:CHAD domain-containing protein
MFSDYYRERAIKPFRNELRRIAKMLGTVRDLEVIISKTRLYIDTLPEAGLISFQPLLDQWQSDLDIARKSLAVELNGEQYKKFTAAFAEFVMTPGQGAAEITEKDNEPLPYMVQFAVPTLIYERYAAVRAYEPVLAFASLDTLHTLRIQAKRLRYTIEAFEEVLGPEAKAVIDAIKELQTHLGDLQDARVASAVVDDYLSRVGEYQPISALLQYRAAREAEKQQLQSSIPTVWKTFIHTDNRRNVALAVMPL